MHVEVRCWHWGSFLNCTWCLFLETGSLSKPEAHWFPWLTNELQGLDCLHTSSAGIIGHTTHTKQFLPSHACAGSPCLYSRHLPDWAISIAPGRLPPLIYLLCAFNFLFVFVLYQHVRADFNSVLQFQSGGTVAQGATEGAEITFASRNPDP